MPVACPLSRCARYSGTTLNPWTDREGTSMKAWLFQDPRQKQKLGTKNAPWFVGWFDADGRRRSKKVGSKSMAEKFARKKEGELAAGLLTTQVRKPWKVFRTEYEAKILPTLATGTQRCVREALELFQKIAKPCRVDAIRTQVIDAYVAARRQQRGRKKGDLAQVTLFAVVSTIE